MEYCGQFVLDKFFPGVTSGIMVEVGAAGPDYLSLSKPFKSRGWRTICVEPNPEFAKMHRDCGNEIYEVALSDTEQSGASFSLVRMPEHFKPTTMESRSAIQLRQFHVEGEVEIINVHVTTLTKLLNNIGVDKVDCVSVDTEGWELEVLRGFDLRQFSPMVLIVENFLGGDGCANYLECWNYIKTDKIEYNEIFVRQ